MNWGIKIAILYLSFVGLIVALAVTCFGHKVELESKDYYAKELKFQSQIDATNNANNLQGTIEHTVSGKAVEIVIPKDLLSADFKGEVNFFRPSDSSKDKKIVFTPDSSGKQLFQDESFIKGVYKMQLLFTSNSITYYKEDIINFQ